MWVESKAHDASIDERLLDRLLPIIAHNLCNQVQIGASGELAQGGQRRGDHREPGGRVGRGIIGRGELEFALRTWVVSMINPKQLFLT